MNTHEYQAKIILKKYGIPIPEFAVVSDIDEVRVAVSDMALEQAVIKVQVHAGGRGKAGGVKLARYKEEIFTLAEQMLRMKIINNQTGPAGVTANQLIVSPITEIKKEYYVGAIIDRDSAQAMLIISPEGGVEIEEVAEKDPDRIAMIPIPANGKFRRYQFIRIHKLMGWSGEIAKQAEGIIAGLARAFVDTDASLLEINPLVLTPDHKLVALDAKLSVDENALFRQPVIQGFYDSTQLPINEVRAKEHDLAYVALEGNIGCMVNGAGLAMATMDIIQHYGGRPSNFLDVGGSASQEKVAEGFKIILSDPNVKSILVNIFGGIMNCVTLAAGIIAATSELVVKVPLIIRMEGTNVEQGKKMLQDSGMNFIITEGLSEAAQKAVAYANKETVNT